MTTGSAHFATDLRTPPAASDFVDFPAGFGTRFMLVVDTEEEFDWTAPFCRQSRSVTTIAGMKRGQEYFAKAGVKPLYVVDYPVIADPVASETLAGWALAGAAHVGAHLHPWVTPPDIEEVSVANSFAGNLPRDLEMAKLVTLRDRIARVTGRAPVAFRAGRYGVGPHTGAILRDLGFRVDTSIRSRFSYAAQQGPDFTGMPLRPWRVGAAGDLIELPLSTAWVGPLRRAGDRLQPVIERGGLGAGLLARSGLLQRIPLTPEGVSAGEAVAAIDRLIADGLSLLMFSFHSPTLEPGNTPYVRSAADLRDFYSWWDAVLAHLARRGVASASLDDVMAAADPAANRAQ